MQRAAAREGSFADRLTSIFDARTAVLLRYADEGAHACELVHCVRAAVKAAEARFVEEETALLAATLARWRPRGRSRRCETDRRGAHDLARLHRFRAAAAFRAASR